MATIFDAAKIDFQNNVEKYGTTVKIKHYSETYVSGSFDDNVTRTQSGNTIYVSGIILPVNYKDIQSSFNAVSTEQGRLQTTDKKIFIPGATETTAVMKFGIGSPTYTEHSVMPPGVTAVPPLDGQVVYKKVFLRVLTLGTLTGE